MEFTVFCDGAVGGYTGIVTLNHALNSKKRGLTSKCKLPQEVRNLRAPSQLESHMKASQTEKIPPQASSRRLSCLTRSVSVAMFVRGGT